LRTITEPGPTPQLNKKNLLPLLLPIPPRHEQQRTVDVLEAIDRRLSTAQMKRDCLERACGALLPGLMQGTLRVAEAMGT